MEKTNGENAVSKEEPKEKRVSYSVETPYGFHLDLDFLKYVHDIEKGNTIKRIHIHRRAKQSKFSTLPRNFSVPENGSQSYSAASSRTWSPSRSDSRDSQVFSGNDSSLRLRYVHELNYRRKDTVSDATLQELVPEDFSGCRDRPQFARASSLPASLPQSTMSSDPTHYLKVTRNIDSRLGSSEEPLSLSRIQSDDQLAAAFKKIKELEEQIKTIPELQKTIYVLEGKNNKLNTQLKSLSQFLGNIKDQEGEDFLEGKAKTESSENGNGEVNGQVCYDNVSDSPFSTIRQQVTDLTKRFDDRAREVHNLRVLVEKQNNELKAKDVYIADLTKMVESVEESRREAGSKQYRDMEVNTEEVEEKRESLDKNTYANIGVETRSVGCGVHHEDLDQLPDDTVNSLAASNLEGDTTVPVVHDKMLVDDNTECNSVEIENVTKTDAKEGDEVETLLSDSQILQPRMCDNNKACNNEEPTNIKRCPTVHQPPAEASIGQYVKRIQDLLQEQWTCLEHGYPDLASAIRQPASKLSSIQNQLVNSLNLLSSVYSSSERENFKPDSQKAEASPRSLKSIMKKKNSSGRSAGETRAKKNLQFVGVNGGYETTSSEDSSSSEDDGDSDGEKTEIAPRLQDGGGGDHMGNTALPDTEQAEEKLLESPGPTSETRPSGQRCTVGETFRSECQILSSHLAELRTTQDNKLRQILYTVCQEWFRVSSQKTSSPELVAVYLEEFRSISPQLLQMVVNIADENGNTSLHYSVSHSNFRIVKLLLDTGVCDVDHQNKAGYTPVMLTPLASAETDEDMEVVKALLTLGNVNLCASQGGQTALMLGVSHGRSDMVKVLLECGADVNLTAEDGETALIIACQVGNLEIVRLLVSHPDCDVELTDKAGNSALSIVLDSAHSEIAELLQAHTEHRRSCPSADMGEGGSL